MCPRKRFEAHDLRALVCYNYTFTSDLARDAMMGVIIALDVGLTWKVLDHGSFFL